MEKSYENINQSCTTDDKMQCPERNTGIWEDNSPRNEMTADSVDSSDEERQEIEFPVSRLGSKVDIMNIVMKRKIGNSSSNENSPIKRRKLENSEETDSDINERTTSCENLLQKDLHSSPSIPQSVAKDIASFITSPLENRPVISEILDKYESQSEVSEESESDKEFPHQTTKFNLSPSNHAKSVEYCGQENDRMSEEDSDQSELEEEVERKSHTDFNCKEASYRSEIILPFTSKISEKESQNVEDKINDTEKDTDTSSSEVRMTILPTVYKTERAVKNDRKSDETDYLEAREEIDETDGDDNTSPFKRIFKGKTVREDGITSHFFQSTLVSNSKKSRKQVMPKRVVKQIHEEEHKQIINKHENTALSVAELQNQTTLISVNQKNSEKSPGNEQTYCMRNDNNTSIKSHEKSRKQSAPKRIIDLAIEADQREKKTGKGKSMSDFKFEEKLSDLHDSPELLSEKSRKQCHPHKVVHEMTNSGAEVKDAEKGDDENAEKDVITTVSNDEPQNSVASDNDTKDFIPTAEYMNQCVSPYFKNLNIDMQEHFLTPELASLSQQIAIQAELLEKLRQDRIQLDEAHKQTTEMPTDDNLTFVRKLREIRFYKYRKISISEKKHIAGYAKIHGVSRAANYFGVSKSAVSLWTRTDFKETDEELARKKRNCMIGNEKFEALVQRVREAKPIKFKTLSREDKLDVVKYAKLVGVREMSRCLDIALGTVSGWMRQFPYDIKKRTDENKPFDETTSQDVKSLPSETTPDSKTEKSLHQNGANDVETKKQYYETGDTLGFSEKLGTKVKDLSSEGDKINAKLDPVSEVCDSTNDEDKEMKFEPSSEGDDKSFDICEAENSLVKEEKNNVYYSTDKADQLNCENSSDDIGFKSSDSSNEENNRNESSSHKTSSLDIETALENMIAESYVKPDVERCFDDVRDQIEGTVLDGDEYFEQLFKRVAETRVEKYKTLKASEKLEVVRFAKRIGVRKIAKIMDLATGTLSGWITKYQHLLGLVLDSTTEDDSSIFNLSSVDLDHTLNSTIDSDADKAEVKDDPEGIPKIGADSVASNLERPSSILDNVEKTEVTALKYLLKERFPLLQGKIDLARKVKFKNLIPSEKIEIVKCAKLVGIRPTARVFQMPIGTLSGWITKYSCFLEPEFQGNGQRSASVSSWSDNSFDTSLIGLNDSDSNTSTALKVAPHLQWTSMMSKDRSDDTEISDSPYSQMMNQMSEKSFTNINDLNASSYELDTCSLNSKTNLLNRRVSVEWPKLNDPNDTSSETEVSWPKLKLPNGTEEALKVPGSDTGFPSFLLHGNTIDFDNDETTKAMAQQYLQQFGMVQFSDQT